ncbi:Uncharacterized protein TPAR_00943 [Tolypocladium paradoxum]|uniref:CCHC-type domain-containing protein n=1 Tax=Tolypocladium paradoxum TaxID=94208 RepID=A0A2S4L8T9_9HYPO|nr:Uncharacterized protein TPAR_00943 [Tolypocladium paradoxum]
MALGERTMERLRTDLLMRARSERREAGAPQSDHGQAATQRVEMEQQNAGSRRARRHLPRFNTLSRAFGRRNHNVEGPKSPGPNHGPPTIHYSELDVSALSVTSPSSAASLLPQGSMPLQPEPVATPIQMTVFNGPDPTVSSQASADASGQSHEPDRHGDEESGGRPHPKRFLFCFPWIKSRRVRSQVLTCFVSGVFLCSLVAIYLGLSLTRNIRQGELTIMIILVILAAAALFSYSTIRLCLLVCQPDRSERRRTRAPGMFGPGGYVVLPKPIPVVLAQDEEAAGIEGGAAKLEPPAYGLWRESVRVDPNRLFWQRNASAGGATARPETRTGPRPPSYASDDGISYVVEARPRSVAPPPSSVYSSDMTPYINDAMSSLSRRACYKCGNVGHYAEVCSSAERLCYNCTTFVLREARVRPF